ncbi:hypothetical protein BDW74DRAFT_31032 [Aspergillus multicolor]|uniref:uncharacterized protein n=1 Tax=Aspergillus multicolor TaxID=41759 RepID=UPI003CCCF37A
MNTVINAAEKIGSALLKLFLAISFPTPATTAMSRGFVSELTFAKAAYNVQTIQSSTSTESLKDSEDEIQGLLKEIYVLLSEQERVSENQATQHLTVEDIHASKVETIECVEKGAFISHRAHVALTTDTSARSTTDSSDTNEPYANPIDEAKSAPSFSLDPDKSRNRQPEMIRLLTEQLATLEDHRRQMEHQQDLLKSEIKAQREELEASAARIENLEELMAQKKQSWCFIL